MLKRLFFLYAALAIFLLHSCNKQEAEALTLIEVDFPKENTYFFLPDTIHAQIFVQSNEKIKYIRVCVSNSQQIPIFSPVYFYPESLQAQLSFEYELEKIQINQIGPFYFQVSVETQELTNSFTEIQIETKTNEYKGFYLFTRPTVNETKIVFVDNDLTLQHLATVSGNYSASAVSAVHDSYYFMTETPAKMYAGQTDIEQFLWIKEPDSDFPEFTSLYAFGNKVFCGYKNGKIVGFSDLSGDQFVNAPALTDTFPEKILVTEKYIFGDFKVKNKLSRSLSVFYKTTGARFQTASHFMEVVDFYVNENSNELWIFGNEEGNAVLTQYFVEGNYFNGSNQISQNPISSTCRVGESTFLFSSENKVFTVNSETFLVKQLVELDEEIISIDFEAGNQVVIIATSSKVYFYAYPLMQQIQVFNSVETIKNIELRYAI